MRCLILLVSLISFNVFAQHPYTIGQKISGTICNENFLSEATVEDIYNELAVTSIYFIYFWLSTDLQDASREFVRSNGRCDYLGNTPLHLAVNAGASPEVIKKLIHFGSNLYLPNNNDVTVLELLNNDDRYRLIVLEETVWKNYLNFRLKNCRSYTFGNKMCL